MVNEIELKLAVGDIHEEPLNTLLHHFHVIEQQEAFLTNTYYDTADNYFTRQKMGLRVRQQDDQYTLTLKADGKVSGCIYARNITYNCRHQNLI